MVDFWIEWVATLLHLDCNNLFMTWIPTTGRRYLLTEAGCSVQTDHNDFPVQKNASPGYFFLIHGDGEGKMYV